MAFYIRKGNKVFQTMTANEENWSEITTTTTSLVVMAFTTRRDAELYKQQLSDSEAVVSNNLEYIL